MDSGDGSREVRNANAGRRHVRLTFLIDVVVRCFPDRLNSSTTKPRDEYDVRYVEAVLSTHLTTYLGPLARREVAADHYALQSSTAELLRGRQLGTRERRRTGRWWSRRRSGFESRRAFMSRSGAGRHDVRHRGAQHVSRTLGGSAHELRELRTRSAVIIVSIIWLILFSY